MVTIKDNYVLDEEKLDVILSNLEHNLKTLFENDASSARPEGSLEVCKMYWWQHKDKTPLVSTGCIQRSFHIDKVERPKEFKEYNIKWEQQPNCVEPEIFDFV